MALEGSDTDPWDDVGYDEDGRGQLGAAELAAVRRELETSGFREGVDDGKEETVQEGFNAGFADAAVASTAVGKLDGALRMAESLLAAGLLPILKETASGDAVASALEETKEAISRAKPDISDATKPLVAKEAALDEAAEETRRYVDAVGIDGAAVVEALLQRKTEVTDGEPHPSACAAADGGAGGGLAPTPDT